MAKMFFVFNISRVSICNQLSPNLDVKVVKGEGNNSLLWPIIQLGERGRCAEQTGSPQLWQVSRWCGSLMVPGSKEGLAQCGARGGGVRVSDVGLRLLVWPRAVCQP